MKNKYTVYFEVFGKKMKTEVLATDQQEARSLVLGRVIFHRIECDNFEDTTVQNLKNIFGMR